MKSSAIHLASLTAMGFLAACGIQSGGTSISSGGEQTCPGIAINDALERVTASGKAGIWQEAEKFRCEWDAIAKSREVSLRWLRQKAVKEQSISAAEAAAALASTRELESIMDEQRRIPALFDKTSRFFMRRLDVICPESPHYFKRPTCAEPCVDPALQCHELFQTDGVTPADHAMAIRLCPRKETIAALKTAFAACVSRDQKNYVANQVRTVEWAAKTGIPLAVSDTAEKAVEVMFRAINPDPGRTTISAVWKNDYRAMIQINHQTAPFEVRSHLVVLENTSEAITPNWKPSYVERIN
ncbi:MAG: hypothetical protein GMKNLPBB_01470 [Myxococcota bacterium]|nr:hypothetical protein [Myxococcota bacterium]